MTYKQIQKEIGKLANRIDEWLREKEEKHQCESRNYYALLYLARELRFLADELDIGY